MEIKKYFKELRESPVIKKISLITLIIVFSCSIVSAQSLFDDAERANADMSSYRYYNKDKDGFTYSGGVNYAPPYNPTEKIIELHADVEAGCARFDWEVNWKNTLNQEALDRYWEALKGGAISSAPILLLEYISPTLADIVKHLKAMSSMSMEMQYANCERMQALATDLGSSLRNREYRECMAMQPPDDMVAARKNCEDKIRGDWASGLNKYQGGKSLNEGEGYTLFGGSNSPYHKKSLDDVTGKAKRNYVSALFGELTIKADGRMHWTQTGKDVKELYREEKEKQREKMTQAVEKYEENREYTEDDAKDLSSPNIVVTKEYMESISNLSEAEQQIAIGAYASLYARNKIVSELSDDIAERRKIMLDPDKDAKEKKMAATIAGGLKIAADTINSEFKLGKEANETMMATISRSRGQRTKEMLNLGVTATEDDIQAQFPGSPLLKE